MKYCEGSLKAEIIFSLTGGREGKLISNAPPVEIFIADKAIKWSIYKDIPIPGNSAADRVDLGRVKEFITLANRYDESTFTRTIVFAQVGRSSPSTVGIGGRFYAYAGIYEADYVRNRLIINPTPNILVDSTRVIWEDIWDTKLSERNDYPGWGIYDQTKENVFCIQDTLGVLYFHQIPKGFTPTWQVTCIGCQQGECAGSDGKGGVVCMDCKQMEASIKYMQNKLR